MPRDTPKTQVISERQHRRSKLQRYRFREITARGGPLLPAEETRGGARAGQRADDRPRAPEVIVLTTFDADDNVLGGLRAGASGFLLKDSPPAQIVAAIRRVAEGEPILSPAITRRLMDRAVAESGARDKAKAALAGLTPREREVVLGIAHGETNAEIAARLFMSVATVKAHITHILTKLGATV
jgi:DNA-binding NarL/FixJ family response regulator